MTVQRQIVLDTIRASSEHLSAEQIYNIVIEKMPQIVIATIYNSLNYLEKENYIRRIKIAGEPDHFDKNLHPHDHIICDECKAVQDIIISDIKKEVEQKYNIAITGYEINIHYVCDKCSKTKL